MAMTFSNGAPFRQPLYKNYLLLPVLAILTIINLVFLLVDSQRIFDMYEMTYWPENLAEGLEENSVELAPLPAIDDPDYGYFRPR